MAVLEKNFIASGATGKSSACIRQHYSTEITARMVRCSLDVFEHFEKKGNWLFISGPTPTTPAGKTIATDMHAQLRQALQNTKNIVDAAGGTMEDIVSIRYYFKAGYMEEGLAALRDLGRGRSRTGSLGRSFVRN